MEANKNPKTKNILWGIFAVVLVAVFAVWMLLNPRPEHIEDANGSDNYALQTITEQDVAEHTMGSRGTVKESETHYDFGTLNISDGKKYSSKKFTGVYCVYSSTLLKGSDIYVNLAEFEIKEGNFAFYIVFDGEVVGQVQPSESAISEFTLNNVEKTGSLEYIIAGESANFKFTMPQGEE